MEREDAHPPFDRLRANGSGAEIVRDFPFVLSLSKHERSSPSTSHLGELYATTSGFPSLTLSRSGDYILWYAKSVEQVKYRQLYRSKEAGDEGAGEYRWLLMTDGTMRSMTDEEIAGRAALPKGVRRWRYGPLTSSGFSEEGSKPFRFQGKDYSPGPSNHWKVQHSGLTKLAQAGLLIARANSLAYYLFADYYPAVPINSTWADTKWDFDAGDKS